MTVTQERRPVDAFWNEIEEKYWETRPGQWADCPYSLPITSDDLYNALLRVGPRAPSSALPKTSLYIDGRAQIVDYEDSFPTVDDEDMHGFLARMERKYAGHDWTLGASGLHHVSVPIWDAAKALSDTVSTFRGGRPPGRVDFDTFIGRYRSTQVGIHVDGASNFGFTLIGKKTLLTWPSDTAADVRQLTLDYDQFRSTAYVLQGEPGAVTYFPSEELHVGECPDEPTVSVNIAFFVDASSEEFVRKAILDSLGGLTSPRLAAQANGRVATSTVAPLLDNLTALTDTDQLAERALEYYMIDSTSGGLRIGRPIVDVPAVPTGRVKLCDGATILYADDSREEGTVRVAANGNLMRVHESPELLVALQALADRDPMLVPSADDANGSDRTLAAIAYRLATWGAIEPA